MNNRLFIDFHVLQTVPPSCVNRDDTGSPKTAVYGGTTRARVSSQAWKRAIRMMFLDMHSGTEISYRTKRISELLEDEILKLKPDADAQKLVIEILKNVGINYKEKDNITDSLVFVSRAQVYALAKLAVDGVKVDAKSKVNPYKEALMSEPSVDIVLFGRMLANDPSLNYDAAVQVAHSISTHTIHNEFDYFTAVDDRKPEDSNGAGHLGTVEFNSSTLYRYATINVMELNNALKKDTPHTVRCFAEAFIRSMPTGKQNTFANRTLPDLVYITIRRDQPVNLAGAFECPVKADGGGYVKASVLQLIRYTQKLYSTFADKPSCSFVVGIEEGIDVLGNCLPLNELLEALETTVAEQLAECEVK